MACTSQKMLFKVQNASYQLIRKFHFNSVLYLNQKWREEQKLTVNPNSFGPLTNLPDYSFKDGRVAPFGLGQKARIDKQREILVKIKKLVGEIDDAVVRHKLLQEEKINQKKLLAETGLKEKKLPFFKKAIPAKKT